MHKRIELTGDPGGGKTTLIRELAQDPVWCRRFLTLPEAIFVVGRVGISPYDRLFQRLIVETQRGLEDALARLLDQNDPRLILCHRGTLDPLAYWLDRGWPEDEFFAFTETCRDLTVGSLTALRGRLNTQSHQELCCTASKPDVGGGVPQGGHHRWRAPGPPAA